MSCRSVDRKSGAESTRTGDKSKRKQAVEVSPDVFKLLTTWATPAFFRMENRTDFIFFYSFMVHLSDGIMLKGVAEG